MNNYFKKLILKACSCFSKASIYAVLVGCVFINTGFGFEGLNDQENGNYDKLAGNCNKILASKLTTTLEMPQDPESNKLEVCKNQESNIPLFLPSKIPSEVIVSKILVWPNFVELVEIRELAEKKSLYDLPLWSSKRNLSKAEKSIIEDISNLNKALEKYRKLYPIIIRFKFVCKEWYEFIRKFIEPYIYDRIHNMSKEKYLHEISTHFNTLLKQRHYVKALFYGVNSMSPLSHAFTDDQINALHGFVCLVFERNPNIFVRADNVKLIISNINDKSKEKHRIEKMPLLFILDHPKENEDIIDEVSSVIRRNCVKKMANKDLFKDEIFIDWLRQL